MLDESGDLSVDCVEARSDSVSKQGKLTSILDKLRPPKRSRKTKIRTKKEFCL